MPGPPRFFCPIPLVSGVRHQLPAGAARHMQVLRLQPGDPVRLFDNTSGGEFDAAVTAMGRQSVEVLIGQHQAVDREARRAVHLAIGMPANERMDWLVEKATELGVASIQPLMTQHGVVRLRDERATKRADHWRGIAIAACEQCGRNRLPRINSVASLIQWSSQLDKTGTSPQRLVLSLAPGAQPLQDWLPAPGAAGAAVTLLCGPEGGLSAAEQADAAACGFVPVSLGARVLRSETAALVALTLLA